MFESLRNVPRLLLEQELRPIQGTAFSPLDLRTWGPRITGSTTVGGCCSWKAHSLSPIISNRPV